jgi:hypothetical protein
MTVEQAIFATISALVALLGVVLTLRNWVYGGSVIRVELELARRESWGAVVSGTVARWRSGVGTDIFDGLRLMPQGVNVDLIKITVRNLGRTAATVHDVGLRIGPPPTAKGSWTGMPLRLLPLGETAGTVRVEAHDAKIFYFHAIPILRGARQTFGNVPLAVRGSVSTGVGKQRLSPRWHQRKWNVWRVKGDVDRSVSGVPLSTREQARLWVEITEDTFEPSIVWVRQITDKAADLADSGMSLNDMRDELAKLYAIFGPQQEPSRDASFMDAISDYLVRSREDPAGNG